MTVFILVLIIYTGFILPVRGMQGWLRWLNYLNPVAYAFESLMANEFHNRQFPCLSFIPLGPTYVNATGTQRSCSVAGGLPGSTSIDGDAYIGNVYGYYYSHLWRYVPLSNDRPRLSVLTSSRNFGIMIAFILFFMVAYLLAAEKVSFEESKGEVLIYRRGHAALPQAKSSEDEECQAAGIKKDTHSPTTSNHAEPLTQPVQIQKQTAIFHWKDVCYDINIRGKNRVILDHVNGWVKPGTLTALMVSFSQ